MEIELENTVKRLYDGREHPATEVPYVDGVVESVDSETAQWGLTQTSGLRLKIEGSESLFLINTPYRVDIGEQIRLYSKDLNPNSKSKAIKVHGYQLFSEETHSKNTLKFLWRQEKYYFKKKE